MPVMQSMPASLDLAMHPTFQLKSHQHYLEMQSAGCQEAQTYRHFMQSLASSLEKESSQKLYRGYHAAKMDLEFKVGCGLSASGQGRHRRICLGQRKSEFCSCLLFFALVLSRLAITLRTSLAKCIARTEYSSISQLLAQPPWIM